MIQKTDSVKRYHSAHDRFLKPMIVNFSRSRIALSRTGNSRKCRRHYNRVKILLEENKNIEFIHIATKIAKPVIKQYQAIFYQCLKDC